MASSIWVLNTDPDIRLTKSFNILQVTISGNISFAIAYPETISIVTRIYAKPSDWGKQEQDFELRAISCIQSCFNLNVALCTSLIIAGFIFKQSKILCNFNVNRRYRCIICLLDRKRAMTSNLLHTINETLKV